MFAKPQKTVELEDQLKAVAELVYHPGYIALLDFIQADIDNLADKMAETSDARELLSITRRWQARREHLYILKTCPEQFVSVVNQEKAAGNITDDLLTPIPAPALPIQKEFDYTG